MARVAGFKASFGQLMLAPKGTPPAVVTALNEALGVTLIQPETHRDAGDGFAAHT